MAENASKMRCDEEFHALLARHGGAKRESVFFYLFLLSLLLSVGHSAKRWGLQQLGLRDGHPPGPQLTELTVNRLCVR